MQWFFDCDTYYLFIIYLKYGVVIHQLSHEEL